MIASVLKFDKIQPHKLLKKKKKKKAIQVSHYDETKPANEWTTVGEVDKN